MHFQPKLYKAVQRERDILKKKELSVFLESATEIIHNAQQQNLLTFINIKCNHLHQKTLHALIHSFFQCIWESNQVFLAIHQVAMQPDYELIMIPDMS